MTCVYVYAHPLNTPKKKKIKTCELRKKREANTNTNTNTNKRKRSTGQRRCYSSYELYFKHSSESKITKQVKKKKGLETHALTHVYM